MENSFDMPQRLQQVISSTTTLPEDVREATNFMPPTDNINRQSSQQLMQQLQMQQRNVHDQQISPSLETETKNVNLHTIQYDKHEHSDRYQYRLNSNAFDKVQRQRVEEAKRVAKLRVFDEMKRQQQVNELHQLRIKQMEQLQEQERLQQKRKMEQKQKIDDERRRQSKTLPKNGEPAPLYLDQDNYVNYYEDEIQEITPSPIVHKLPSTYMSFYSTPSTEARDYGFNFPCDSYNDDICYQQHMQLKSNEIHRCCKNRLLFTDHCRPGKCSNVTQQLCCIQKFLQAKLICCTDEKQLEVNVPGDHFNRCCYNHFVTEDDTCCPSSYANDQWRTINELCHPNVDIDLSRVRVLTVLSGTSLTTEFDFSKTDKWNFTCKYGLHVPQFNYNFD